MGLGSLPRPISWTGCHLLGWLWFSYSLGKCAVQTQHKDLVLPVHLQSFKLVSDLALLSRRIGSRLLVMSFIPSLVLLFSGLLVSPSLAQNATYGGNLTETIGNATTFIFPQLNLTTLTIQYQPPPLSLNGSFLYNLTYPSVQERVSYFTIDGLAIIEGDIIFGTEADILAHAMPHTKRGEHQGKRSQVTRRALSIAKDDVRKWPGAVVEYYWESQATKTAREADFLAACKIWTDRLPWLKFVNKGIKATSTLNGPIVLKLSTKSVSSSPVGRAESASYNYMVLGSASTLGIYVHEIGHSECCLSRTILMMV
jgi:hypothetical protein